MNWRTLNGAFSCNLRQCFLILEQGGNVEIKDAKRYILALFERMFYCSILWLSIFLCQTPPTSTFLLLFSHIKVIFFLAFLKFARTSVPRYAPEYRDIPLNERKWTVCLKLDDEFLFLLECPFRFFWIESCLNMLNNILWEKTTQIQ